MKRCRRGKPRSLKHVSCGLSQVPYGLNHMPRGINQEPCGLDGVPRRMKSACLLCGCSVCKDVGLLYRDLYIACNFEHNDILCVVNLLDFSVNASVGYDIHSRFEGVAEFLDFLLLLLLRTYHEKIHDGENCHNHYKESGVETSLSLRSGLKD